MKVVSDVVIGLVGLLHVYFLVLEMFLWERRAGLRAFGMTQEFAASTKVLAANQGLYNGFLAAGLFWGLSLGSAGLSVKTFFLALRSGGGHLRCRNGRAGRSCSSRRSRRRWGWPCFTSADVSFIDARRSKAGVAVGVGCLLVACVVARVARMGPD